MTEFSRQELEQIIHRALNDGLMGAVTMMRAAHERYPNMSVTDIANAIEATVVKDPA